MLGSDFHCNGRITGYLISLDSRGNSGRGNSGRGNSGRGNSGTFPNVQVWRLTNMNSGVYTIVGTACPLTDGDITMMSSSDSTDGYYLGNVSCTIDRRIEFQSGDIIGYNQGARSRYSLWIINAVGYTSYSRNGPSRQLDTFNINNNRGTSNRQPLIQMIFGNMHSTY